MLYQSFWLRKSYPTVIFINTNLPEKHFRICCTEEELSELPEDGTDVFKRNILSRYMDRPNETYKKCALQNFAHTIIYQIPNAMIVITNQMFLKVN